MGKNYSSSSREIMDLIASTIYGNKSSSKNKNKINNKIMIIIIKSSSRSREMKIIRITRIIIIMSIIIITDSLANLCSLWRILITL